MEAKGVSSLAKRGKRAYDVLTEDESRAAALDSLLVKLQAAQERREVSGFASLGAMHYPKCITGYLEVGCLFYRHSPSVHGVLPVVSLYRYNALTCIKNIVSITFTGPSPGPSGKDQAPSSKELQVASAQRGSNPSKIGVSTSPTAMAHQASSSRSKTQRSPRANSNSSCGYHISLRSCRSSRQKETRSGSSCPFESVDSKTGKGR